MNPKKKSRRCRGHGLDSGLDLAISRFIYSFACIALENICGGSPYCPILMYSIQHYNILATFHTHDTVLYSNSPPLPPSSLLPSGLPPSPPQTLPDLIVPVR